MLEPRLTPPKTKPNASVARIPDAWYAVLLSQDLGKKPVHVTVLGTPLVVFRTARGTPGALLDRCPHRNVPLSVGKVEGDNLVCGYHGWAFDVTGRCRHVPGLVGELDQADRSRRTIAWPAVETDGFIWVWGNPDTEPRGAPFRFPTLPGYTEARRTVSAPGTLHATIENALDVPHTAFLHGGLFRTAQKKNRITAVVRRYADRAECEYIGEPRPTGLVARLLSPGGGVVTHFDRFFLPSVAQVEYRLGDDTHFVVTSACTPVSDFETKLFALVQFKLGRIPGGLVKPLLEPFARRIFAQDATMLKLQTDTIQRFGGEQFESTELDLLGPQIWRLMREAERGEPAIGDADEVLYEKRIELMT